MSLRQGIAARALAAGVALALSGAPGLAASLRPDAEHVCQCRAHGEKHRCACPICARLLREARRGAVEKLPPCHKAMALADLAEEEALDALAATVPCLKPTCGGEDTRTSAPGGDSYVAPAATSIAAPRRVEPIAALVARPLELPAAPDVPPPKRA
jgi:hypothetical protein